MSRSPEAEKHGRPCTAVAGNTGSVGTLRPFPLISKEAWEPESRNCLWFSCRIRIEKRRGRNNTDREAIWRDDADKTQAKTGKVKSNYIAFEFL